MRQKRLMLLGGIRHLLPVIDAAHKLGAYGQSLCALAIGLFCGWWAMMMI